MAVADRTLKYLHVITAAVVEIMTASLCKIQRRSSAAEAAAGAVAVFELAPQDPGETG